MNNYFDNTPLLKSIFKWKWHIITVTVVSALLGAIFSGPTFIPPMYKSTTLLYPSNIASYSEETYTEQMLQIMDSQEITDSVIEKFNLADHYEIKKNKKHWRSALLKEYASHIDISKTKYNAVEIEVTDEDPVLACDIVKEITRLYDKKIATMHKSKRKEVLEMLTNQLNEKAHYIDSLKNELNKITEGNDMLQYSYMSNDNSIAYLTNTNKANGNVSDAISLVELISLESRSYVGLKGQIEIELRFINSNMTYSNIISEPFVADKKYYPIRSLIVALCGLSAFLISLFAVLAIETVHYFKR